MPSYLYIFEFCAPENWQLFTNGNACETNSYAFFVQSENALQALKYGEVVSELFVNHLFKQANWHKEIPSWIKQDFAHWIENNPSTRYTSDTIETFPVVSANKIPIFDGWMPNGGLGKIIPPPPPLPKQNQGCLNDTLFPYVFKGIILGSLFFGGVCGILYVVSGAIAGGGMVGIQFAAVMGGVVGAIIGAILGSIIGSARLKRKRRERR